MLMNLFQAVVEEDSMVLITAQWMSILPSRSLLKWVATLVMLQQGSEITRLTRCGTERQRTPMASTLSSMVDPIAGGSG